MTEPVLVDTHCHVDFHHFDADREAVLERFAAAGGRWLVAVSVELEAVPRLRALAESTNGVYFSVGVHPNHVVDAEPALEQLCTLAAHPRCVAIGETGLDFFRRHVSPELQRRRFRLHLRAARAVGKPVIVHMREADDDTLELLAGEDVEACGGIMHCFSSGWRTARAALDMGMYVSFSGNVTFRRNDALRAVAARVPEDRLLIETDAPYLAPEPHRGRRNEPALVRHVAACIARERGLDVAQLAALTAANAARCFGLEGA